MLAASKREGMDMILAQVLDFEKSDDVDTPVFYM
jgi:hypothetical protein